MLHDDSVSDISLESHVKERLRGATHLALLLKGRH